MAPRISVDLPGNMVHEKLTRRLHYDSGYDKINLLCSDSVPNNTYFQTLPELFEFLASRPSTLPAKLRCVSGSVTLDDRCREPWSNPIPNK